MFKKLLFSIFILTISISCSEEDETKPEVIQVISPDDDVIPGDIFALETLQIETSWNTEDRTTVSKDATTHGPADYYFLEEDLMILISKEDDGKRTELKETPGQERSLSIPKTLSYTATVVNIPENGVTIAQVHNRASGVLRPLVRVYIDADLRVKFKLTDDPDSATQYTTINGPAYQEGQTISVRMDIVNGTASFMATTPSGTVSQTFTPSNNWAPYSNSYYFKAGVYTEGNDMRAQIRFSEFTLVK